MIKLIATDMDGTLLNAAHEISEENINAIKYAQSKGITVVIATGRAFYEASTPMAETDLKVPYICLNGAEVRDESFNIMNTSHLNHELVERIKAILDREDVYYQVYTNRGIYTEDPTRDLDIYLDIARNAGQQGDVEKIKAGIQKRIDNGTLKIVDNYKDIEDIPGSEMCIRDRLRIDLQDVMALGDNLNDVSMLERVGYPVAMDNAMPEVKAIAKLVTDTNEHIGVGKAIMKVLTEEK